MALNYSVLPLKSHIFYSLHSSQINPLSQAFDLKQNPPMLSENSGHLLSCTRDAAHLCIHMSAHSPQPTPCNMVISLRVKKVSSSLWLHSLEQSNCPKIFTDFIAQNPSRVTETNISTLQKIGVNLPLFQSNYKN